MSVHARPCARRIAAAPSGCWACSCAPIPGAAPLALVAVFVASLFEGLGMSMLLSMLSLASGPMRAAPPSKPQQVRARRGVAHGHHAHGRCNLLFVAIVLIAMRGVMSLLANRQVGYTVAHIATDLRLTLIRAMMGARWSHYLRAVGGRPFQRRGHRGAARLGSLPAGRRNGRHGAQFHGLPDRRLLDLAGRRASPPPFAGAALLLTMRALIRASRHAGEHQTELQKSLLTLISAQFAAAKPLKAMAREDHVDALLTDQTQQLERALRQQVISKEALSAMQEPMLAIMVGIGLLPRRSTCCSCRWPTLIVMLFMLARVVSYLSKGQKAYQQVVMRESAYWSLVNAIDEAHAAERTRGRRRAAVQLARQLRFDAVQLLAWRRTQHPRASSRSAFPRAA